MDWIVDMETGLKSRSLPHKRVLITIPDRTALGKCGLDFPPGGSGGVSVSNITRGCGSQGGGQGCQDKLTENGRGCALILWIRLENKGTTYVKSTQSTAKCGIQAWRVCKERETFAGWTALPLSQFVSPKCPKYKIQQTKDWTRLLALPTPLGGGCFKPRDPVRICLGSELRRGESVEHQVVAPTCVPTAAKKLTPNRALSSANWSCEFEQKGNYVSWRKPGAEFKAWRGFLSGAVCFLKFATPCSETAPAEALGAV